MNLIKIEIKMGKEDSPVLFYLTLWLQTLIGFRVQNIMAPRTPSFAAELNLLQIYIYIYIFIYIYIYI